MQNKAEELTATGKDKLDSKVKEVNKRHKSKALSF